MAGRLVIISHTAHYHYKDQFFGWGPTIREINNVAEEFDVVIHFAPLHKLPMSGGNLPYNRSNIKYIRLLEAGGSGIFNKLKILFFAPANAFIILKIIRPSDWIQLRAPSNIALIMLPIFSILRFFNIWVKYAGNWNEKSPAFTYKVQRWWLRNNVQGSFVTINGKWEKNGNHILAFENPCINDDELKRASQIVLQKQYSLPLNICFIGQLDENKGIINLIEAFKYLNGDGIHYINKVIVVGDGPLMNKLIEMIKGLNITVELLGYLNHDKIFKVYKDAHINILPSKSEGFPKVIAEGAAYGCIPVVTNMSSLDQYIKNNENGILLPDNSSESIYKALKQIVSITTEDRKTMAINATKMAENFTYEHYVKRIFADIINAPKKEN